MRYIGTIMFLPSQKQNKEHECGQLGGKEARGAGSCSGILCSCKRVGEHSGLREPVSQWTVGVGVD